MTTADFEVYANESIPLYARDKVESGQWTENDSLRLAREGFMELLPQGLGTPNNYLFKIRDPAKRKDVGALWFASKERAGERIAYVYDIFIEPSYRRMGYATRAFAALEKEARSRGLSGVALHVFGHNSAAQTLYSKLGYRPTNISMLKKLGRDSD